MINKRRLPQLDIARTVAIALVVFCHSTESICLSVNPSFSDYGSFSRALIIALETTARIGVPLFLFLTGFLLLSKDYTKNNISTFYKKHIPPLIICYALFTIVYNVIQGNPSVGSIIRQLLFLETSKTVQLWYLPGIIGVYFLLPFVSIVLHSVSKRQLKLPLILCFLSFFIIPTANEYITSIGHNSISPQLDLSFTGGQFGFYLVLGYLFYCSKDKIKKIVKNKKVRIIAIVTSILCYLFAIYHFSIMHKATGTVSIWYHFMALPILASFVFAICLATKNKERPLFTSISRSAMGIYLIHPLIQMALTPTLKQLHIHWTIYIAIHLTISFITSYLIVLVARKLFPKLAKIIFLAK